MKWGRLLAGLAVAVTLAGAPPACKHLVRLPGGDIRIGEESEPVGPIITDETRSGVSCGPALPPCQGGTRCFAKSGEALCMTEEAACEAAACSGGLCEILDSFPLQAVCH